MTSDVQLIGQRLVELCNVDGDPEPIDGAGRALLRVLVGLSKEGPQPLAIAVAELKKIGVSIDMVIPSAVALLDELGYSPTPDWAT
jgi:hypothetical protein